MQDAEYSVLTEWFDFVGTNLPMKVDRIGNILLRLGIIFHAMTF
jgi:hypothetical protein